MTSPQAWDNPAVPRSSLYYHHSGTAPPGSVILALVLSAVAALVGATVYSAADVYIPFIYLNCLLTIGFGGLLGCTPVALLRLGRVRNNFITALAVLAVTAVGFYACWVAWIQALVFKADGPFSPVRLFSHPTAVWRIANRINAVGTWSVGDHSDEGVHGIMLWIVWIAEAAIIWGLALTSAKKLAGAQPFCENCRRWCGQAKRLGTAPMRDIGELRQKLEAGDFSSITPLSSDVPDSPQWLSFWHHACPGCGQLNALTVQTATRVKTRQGQTRINLKPVISKLLLHPGEAEQLTPPPTPPAPL